MLSGQRMKAKSAAVKKNKPQAETTVDVVRHQRMCGICRHADRADIDRDFLSWKNPALICRERGIADRSTIYRHAHATGLFERRRRNVRVVLEKLLERVSEVVEINGSVIVQAATALAKINAAGHLVERRETVNLNEMFSRMTSSELEQYARDGILPTWFEQVVGTTHSVDGEESNAE